MGVAERQQREKVLRREQILSAAKKVFLEKGFSGATIEHIAEEAELSIGTLYYYFKNKDDLYASLNLKVLEIIDREMEKVINNKNLSIEGKLEMTWETLYKVYKIDSFALRAILRLHLEDSYDHHSPQLISSLNEISKNIMDKLSLVFEMGIREGKFKKTRPQVMTDIVWSLFTGLVVWEGAKLRFDPKKHFLEPTLKSAFEFITKGMFKEK